MKFKKLLFVVFTVCLINLSLAVEKGKKHGLCAPNYDPNIKTKCKEIYDIFHKCASIFINVALQTADPFTLCTNSHAYQTHRNLTFVFNLLQTSQDQNITCSDKYMNKNSMGVVSKIISFTNSLWDKAYCDDCYINSTTLSQNYSDHAGQFFSLKEKYNNCTKKYQNHSEICTECEEIYLQMNIIFNHHKEKFGKICFDIEDIVNKTRIEWSTKFKCCKDKRDSLTAFYSLFSTILTLTLIFYSSIYCFGSRYSIVETIDANHIVTNTITSVLDRNAPSASSSTSNVKPKELNKPKKALSMNNDDSDDEEPIINDNLIHLND